MNTETLLIILLICIFLILILSILYFTQTLQELDRQNEEILEQIKKITKEYY